MIGNRGKKELKQGVENEDEATELGDEVKYLNQGRFWFGKFENFCVKCMGGNFRVYQESCLKQRMLLKEGPVVIICCYVKHPRHVGYLIFSQ